MSLPRSRMWRLSVSEDWNLRTGTVSLWPNFVCWGSPKKPPRFRGGDIDPTTWEEEWQYHNVKDCLRWVMLWQPSLENRLCQTGWAVTLRACLFISRGLKLVTMVLEPVHASFFWSRAWAVVSAWSIAMWVLTLLHIGNPRLLGAPISTLIRLNLSFRSPTGGRREGSLVLDSSLGSVDWQGEYFRVRCCVYGCTLEIWKQRLLM